MTIVGQSNLNVPFFSLHFIFMMNFFFQSPNSLSRCISLMLINFNFKFNYNEHQTMTSDELCGDSIEGCGTCYGHCLQFYIVFFIFRKTYIQWNQFRYCTYPSIYCEIWSTVIVSTCGLSVFTVIWNWITYALYLIHV